MNKNIGYCFVRTISSTHRNIKNAIHFRHEDVNSVTPDIARAAAKAALKKSELKRRLDLKAKYNGSAEDAEKEKELLTGIANSTNSSLDENMASLLDFYDRLNRRNKA